MKVLITGGHPAPALAVIEELRKRKGVDIVFVGRRHTHRDSTSETYEYSQVSAMNIPFHEINTGRITRVLSVESVKDALLCLRGIYEAYKILGKVKPDSILSFGGFIALPIAYVGALFYSIPVITHEQTLAPGLANVLIARIAKRILVSFPETIKYFDVKKTLVVGNPTRKSAIRGTTMPFPMKVSKPLLYVTGGSLGSHSINKRIEEILPMLLKSFIVIHQTGNVEKYGDFARLAKIRRKGYYVRAHFTSEEVGWMLAHADCVVSRSGANIFFELIAHQKPCVLIPLPWSANNEQRKHARLIAQAGAGLIYEQDEPSEKLFQAIQSVHQHAGRHTKSYRLLKKYVHKRATSDIVSLVLQGA